MIEILNENDFAWVNVIHHEAFGKLLTENDFKAPYNIIGIRNLAYMIYTEVLNEAEIIFIAVDKDYKRKGLATKLVNSLEGQVFLDVNENNDGAINFYKACGFREYARRKNYYPDGDAILMKREERC
ncbi:GNAT family N-acetyltransferase [Ezakiella peruensis]|uniref:GNAT family N-acetyltransferase n=1 Tax=Ezakiella peruensis TaxID=1464038 RepID=UPI000C1AFEEF|nr:GNAT family N-acetyltransferase [Ezakiella peruensis]